MTPSFKPLDYCTWAPEQDIVSNDHYLRPPTRRPDVDLALSGDLTRGLAGGRAVAADGALDQRRQLAAAQPRQAARADAAQQPRARRPRLRRRACSSSGARRGRGAEKFHSAHGPARRHRQPGLAGGGAARAATCGGSPRCAGSRVRGRRRDAVGLRELVGGRARLPPVGRRHLPRPRPGVPRRAVASRASRSTSCTRRTSGPATSSCSSRACTWSATRRPRRSRSTCATGGHARRLLLQRHRRRRRRDPARRLPGRVPRAARRARGGVPARSPTARRVVLDDGSVGLGVERGRCGWRARRR